MATIRRVSQQIQDTVVYSRWPPVRLSVLPHIVLLVCHVVSTIRRCTDASSYSMLRHASLSGALGISVVACADARDHNVMAGLGVKQGSAQPRARVLCVTTVVSAGRHTGSRLA